VLRGIEAVTEPLGYQTMLAHYGYSAEVEQERIASLLSYHVDGLILDESVHTERTLKMIHTAGMPVVEIKDSRSPAIDLAVGFDNAAATAAMVELMIEKGHRRIVYLGARLLGQALAQYPDLDGLSGTNGDLAVGVLFECQRRGITLPEQIGITGFHGHDIGQAMAPRLASVITPRQQIGQLAAERLLARIQEQPIEGDPVLDLGFSLEAGESL